jgi:hypothetical protein
LLFIDLTGIVNCNAFSVVPSIINENAKKRAVPLPIIVLGVFLLRKQNFFLPQKRNFPAALAGRCRPAGGVIKLFFFTLHTFIK